MGCNEGNISMEEFWEGMSIPSRRAGIEWMDEILKDLDFMNVDYQFNIDLVPGDEFTPNAFEYTFLVSFEKPVQFFREGLVLFRATSTESDWNQYRKDVEEAFKGFKDKFLESDTTEPQEAPDNTPLPKGINTGEDTRTFHSESKDITWDDDTNPRLGGKYSD